MANIETYAPGSFCWAELSTTDRVAAAAFYTRLFGWSTSEIPIGEGRVYVILQKNGRDAAALHEDASAPPNWLSYFSVTSVDDTTKTARDLDANVLGGPLDVFDAGRMSVLTDPQGATFAVWQANKTIGAEVFGEPGAMCWTELLTTDRNAAETFYTSLFGWTAKKSTDSPMEYVEWHSAAKGDAVGGMLELTPEMQGMPPCWLPYFVVEDTDASADAAAAAGGTVLMPPADIPNVGRFAFLRDPQGAMFYILKLLPR